MTPIVRADRSFFATDATTLARRLLGQRLVRIVDGARTSGIIVETEAYLGAPDLASHAARGRRTARNETMYGPPGLLYVYFTYGMHHCANVVCAREGVAEAVLLRAVEPEEGVETIRARRAARPRKTALRDRELCAGPGRLCEALGIDLSLDGADLAESGVVRIERIHSRALPASRIESGPRIGLGEVGEWKGKTLRFWVKGSGFVSR